MKKENIKIKQSKKLMEYAGILSERESNDMLTDVKNDRFNKIKNTSLRVNQKHNKR